MKATTGNGFSLSTWTSGTPDANAAFIAAFSRSSSSVGGASTASTASTASIASTAKITTSNLRQIIAVPQCTPNGIDFTVDWTGQLSLNEVITAVAFTCCNSGSNSCGPQRLISITAAPIRSILSSVGTRVITKPNTGNYDAESCPTSWQGNMATGNALIGIQSVGDSNKIRSVRFISASVFDQKMTPSFSPWYGAAIPTATAANPVCVATYCNAPYFITGFKATAVNRQGCNNGLKYFSAMEFTALPRFFATSVTPISCCAGDYAADSAEQVACEAMNYSSYSDTNPGAKISSNCVNTFATYCSKNFTDKACVLYCQDPSNNCDEIGQTYCAGLGADAINHPECACFMPPAFYDTFFTQLKAKVPTAALLPSIPSCYYPPCAGSALRPFGSAALACPNIQQCIENVHVNNDGTITGDVSLYQNNNCHLVSSSSVDGTGIGTGTTTPSGTDDPTVDSATNLPVPSPQVTPAAPSAPGVDAASTPGVPSPGAPSAPSPSSTSKRNEELAIVAIVVIVMCIAVAIFVKHKRKSVPTFANPTGTSAASATASVAL